MKAREFYENYVIRLYQGQDRALRNIKVERKVAILNTAIRYFQRQLTSKEEYAQVMEVIFDPLKTPLLDLKKKKGRGNVTRDFQYYEKPEDCNTIILVEIDVEKDGCEKTFTAEKLMTGEVMRGKESGYYESSIVFEQAYRDQDSNGIRIFHHNNFGIENARIQYYRTIPQVHYVEAAKNDHYFYFGEKKDQNIDLLLGGGGADLIIEVALVMSRDDIADLNLEFAKIMNIRKILN